MRRIALLDLDGTLIDSREDLCRAVNHALAEVGLPRRSLEEVTTFVGEGAAKLVARAVAPRQDLLEPALVAWWEHYRAHLLDTTQLYPGMAEALAGAGRSLAVLTNKPGPLARRILEGLGVLDRFVEVVGGDEAPRKPDPTGARALLARLGGLAEDALFVGDSRIDAATARAAGIPLVGVTWGFGGEAELREAGAERLVSTAAELAAWLR
ncbi:MAG TPA: HAD-IA family hydrolase [Anaeromyxobacteraceae bacterium]|nr:HAD-IA family hydrolase [Anaeromyxobacteraceae bacterium]